MAERAACAAHTTTEARFTPNSINQPSIFDVLAQESLMSGLRPAARHLSKFLAWSYPNLFNGFSRYFDEWYTLGDLLLQNYFLKNYSASFSENFYDIKRVLSSNGNNLPKSQRGLSLIAIVLIPYVRLKLDELHERLKKENERQQVPPPPTKWTRLKEAFLAIYPWICTGLEFWTLFLQAGYILSKSSVHSPWLLFAGVRLERMTAEDHGNMNVGIAKLPSDASIWLRFANLIRRLTATLFRLLSKLLGVALLLVQFLDYWQSSDRDKSKQSSIGSLPIPPAPHAAITEQNVIKMDPRLCPICRKPRQNDTVISVSGYVYCYVCIAKYLQQHRCDPVTKVPADTEHLIRLYVQQENR